jgi:hypothetical protein
VGAFSGTFQKTPFKFVKNDFFVRKLTISSRGKKYFFLGIKKVKKKIVAGYPEPIFFLGWE